MGKLEVSENKTLKLQNVLLYHLKHMEDGEFAPPIVLYGLLISIHFGKRKINQTP